MPETASFQIGGGPPLRGLVTLPDRGGERPAVVICHGFKGFMEWGFFPHLAELLALRGLVAVRFNFGGNGMQPGDELVTDEHAFGTATPGRDLDDLRRVLAATGTEIAADRVDRRRLALIGHSRGGGAALLAAAEHRELSALVTWAAVSSFDRISAADKEAWRRTGELPIVNARTGQTVPLQVEVLEDLEANRERYDLLTAAATRVAPWLIVHGTDDPTVPFTEAEALIEAAAEPAELARIDRGDHTFGARHPFAGPTPALIEALNATQTWLLHHLREEST